MKRAVVAGWVAAAGLAAGMSGTARAAEGSAELAVLSKYVWRGQVVNDEAVLQPSVTVSAGNGLSLNTWGNLDLTDGTVAEGGGDAAGEFTEVDWTVGYALPLEGKLSVELGVIEYLFPFAGSSTREVFVSAGLDTVLAPALSLYYDFDDVEGLYASASVSHGVELPGELTLDLGASVGYGDSAYNEGYFGVADGALNDLTLTAGIGLPATAPVSVSVAVSYSVFLDSEIGDAAAEAFGDDSALVAGLTASYRF